MIKSMITCMMMLACFASYSFAQETSTEPTKVMEAKLPGESCQAGQCTAGKECTASKECTECPIAVAMKSLPVMTYKVGTESTCCSKSAAALAEKSEQPIHYVVADKTFESKDEAFASLVTVTEAQVKEFITPCKCEKSGVTTIAGKTCQCSVMASNTTAKVKAAVANVKMSYVVGEESCDCPNHAASLAKKSGEKQEYVVAGEKTCCSMDARLKLAHAQYKAAVKATLANAEAPQVESTQTSAAPTKVGT